MNSLQLLQKEFLESLPADDSKQYALPLPENINPLSELLTEVNLVEPSPAAPPLMSRPGSPLLAQPAVHQTWADKIKASNDRTLR